MRQGFLKCAAATPVVTVADCSANVAAILKVVERAESDGVKLLVLPELTVTAYTCGDLFLQYRLQRAALEALDKIANATAESDMLLLVGLPLSVEHTLFNAAVLLHHGRPLGAVPKTMLPNYGEFYEKRIFAPAPERNLTAEILGCRVPFGNQLLFACENMPEFVLGVEICEDLWSPLPPSTGLAAAGATVIANLSASDEAVTKSACRRMMVQSQSARTTSAYIFACAGEGESTSDVVFPGHNMLFEAGVLLSESAPFTSGYALSEPDLQYIVHERQRLTRCIERDSDFTVVPFTLDLEETKLTRTFWRTPFVPPEEAEAAERSREIFRIQAEGLKKRIAHTHAKHAILGVSGGVDSTLALLVAVEAMRLLNRPASDVIAVTMPCFGTSKRTRGNAEKLCALLGIPCRTIDIKASVEKHLEDLGHPQDVADTAFENAQARERTQILMDLANMENGLVIGTGDLSELALGFATYNGDHMSMYAVNGGVPKTTIRSMLLSLGKEYGGALEDVLSDIVDTPVSPELLPAKDGVSTQITENLVGPYELTDFFLYHMLRRGEERQKIARLAYYAFEGGYSEETIAKWLDGFLRRFFAQQFKRSCMPDGPRVGSVSLSPRGDWRMPSDASAAEWRK